MESSFVVAIVSERMHISTESTFEYVFRLYLYSFWTLANLVPYLGAIIAYVVLWIIFRELLKQFFCPYEIFLNKDFGVIVRTLGPFFTESIHIVPAQFTNNMFEFACFAVKTEAHIEVGTAFIDVPKRTMLSLLAFFSHKIRADFQIMTKITFVSVAASSHTFEFIARLYFTFIVRVGTIIRQSTFAMNEFFADAISGKFIMVRSRNRLLTNRRRIIQGIIISSGVPCLLLIWVHYNYNPCIQFKSNQQSDKRISLITNSIILLDQ